MNDHNNTHKGFTLYFSRFYIPKQRTSFYDPAVLEFYYPFTLPLTKGDGGDLHLKNFASNTIQIATDEQNGCLRALSEADTRSRFLGD